MINNDFAQKVYQDNKAKGFWDKERPIKEILESLLNQRQWKH
jgi:hypothetical protein